jgi:hypothetical protein
MSSATTPKSDLFQTAKAVLIMSLFALVFIVIVVVKDNITGFICNDARLTGICSIRHPLRVCCLINLSHQGSHQPVWTNMA